VLDKTTGRLVAHDDEKIGLRMFHCSWSSPSAGTVDGRTLIFFGGGDGVLYAFEEPVPQAQTAGVQILCKAWAYDCNPPPYRARDGQPVRYSGASKNTPEGPSEIIGTPVFHQGRVYVAIGQSNVHGVGQGCLSCVDAATGRKVWDSLLVDRTLATVSIADGLLYLPDYTGNLHCFDIASGERLWVHALESKLWCASTYVADGKVYVGTDASVLWVLQAGRQKQVLSRTRLKAVPITLTADDGVLYVPTQKSLIALPGQL
jgi:outer membrane protein assembly factor BamB